MQVKPNYFGTCHHSWERLDVLVFIRQVVPTSKRDCAVQQRVIHSDLRRSKKTMSRQVHDTGHLLQRQKNVLSRLISKKNDWPLVVNLLEGFGNLRALVTRELKSGEAQFTALT